MLHLIKPRVHFLPNIYIAKCGRNCKHLKNLNCVIYILLLQIKLKTILDRGDFAFGNSTSWALELIE